MLGTKAYQEKMFYNFSLSERVPQDHFLRKVAKVVNWSFVRKLVKPYYSYRGQPSVDSMVLFKMMLIGYFYGITSERRLMEETSLNMAFMWYLGYDLDEPIPNHSVISKARARYGKEVFEPFFQKVLGLCVEEGLVGGEKVFVDSTIIKANASLKSLVSRQDLVEPKFSPKEYVEQVFSENPVGKDLPQEGSKKTEELKKEQRGKANKKLVSTTDPDASVYQRPGVPYQLAYKEHVAVDSQARVITAVKVTPAAVTDDRVLPDLIHDQPGKLKEECADKIYGSVDTYAYLFDRDMLPSIPRRSTGGWRYTGGFPTDNFLYDRERDVCICPGNQILKRKGKSYRWH
jgi:transposase